MKIKVLFSDLDGTLVEHSGDATKDTVEAVKRLTNNGIDLVLVSGRHPDLMKSIHRRLELKTPVIGCNGGMIKNLLTDQILYANELSKEIVRETIELCHELQVDWVVYGNDALMYEKTPPSSYRLPQKNQQLPEHLRANYVKVTSMEEVFSKEQAFMKVLILFDEHMDSMEAAKDRLSKLAGVEVSRSAHTYLDVMAQGSSKAKGIQVYLDQINLDKKNTASIGDAQNDIDMIEFTNIGIAMGNAVDGLKKVSNYITTAYPTGFRDAVEYLLKL